MNSSFEQIKKTYDAYYQFLLKKGMLPLKDTGIGFWGTAHSDDLVEIFQKIGLSSHKHLLDLGSGDGKVVFIASLFTDATGIEFHTSLHSVAQNMKQSFSKLPLKKTTLLQTDFFHHPLGGYDVLFLNPDKPLKALEEKVKKEFRGKLILYGAHFHPETLKKEKTYDINGTYITVYVVT